MPVMRKKREIFLKRQIFIKKDRNNSNIQWKFISFNCFLIKKWIVYSILSLNFRIYVKFLFNYYQYIILFLWIISQKYQFVLYLMRIYNFECKRNKIHS